MASNAGPGCHDVGWRWPIDVDLHFPGSLHLDRAQGTDPFSPRRGGARKAFQNSSDT